MQTDREVEQNKNVKWSGCLRNQSAGEDMIYDMTRMWCVKTDTLFRFCHRGTMCRVGIIAV